MDKQKLMDLLGARPTPTPKTGNLTMTTTEGVSPSQQARSDYCLELDKWDIARGEEALSHSPNAQRAEVTKEAMADFHAAAFLQKPQLLNGCTDELRHDFLKTLLDTADYKALHSSTMANVLASEMAATTFGVEYAALKRKEDDRKERQKSSGKNPDPLREEARKLSACLRAVGAALQEATKDVEELEGMQHALGKGPGVAGSRQDAEEAARVFKRVRNSNRLRDIMNRAGRFRLSAQSRQRRKVRHGYDDTVGVELSGDLARVLPHELALLTDGGVLGLDAARRFVERQLMSRHFQGVERVGKGPIVVVVDESGSMSGPKIANAKAFALAMAWIAGHQRRWCALVGFAGGREGTRLVLPPGRWDQAELLDWLEHFYGGGTVCDVPLVQLPNVYWSEFVGVGMRRGKTDLILVTDAIVDVPKEVELNFNEWKQREKVKCVTLLVGSSYGVGGAGDLAHVSDEVHTVTEIGVDEEGVTRCMEV